MGENVVFILLVVETIWGWEEQADIQVTRLGAALDWTGRVGQDQTCIPESGLRPGRFYFSTHALHIVIL